MGQALGARGAETVNYFLVLAILAAIALPLYALLRSAVRRLRLTILRPKSLHPPASLKPSEWTESLEKSSPDEQYLALVRTRADSLNLTHAEFLHLLESLEEKIQEQPALDLYWDLRILTREIIRQDESS